MKRKWHLAHYLQKLKVSVLNEANSLEESEINKTEELTKRVE